MFLRFLATAAAGSLLLLSPIWAMAESNCGCPAPSCNTCCEPKHCCCRLRLFCRSCCCCDGDKDLGDKSFGEKAFAPIPSAMIVDSMPVFQMTPGVVTMPMMMAGFTQGVNTKSLSGNKGEEDSTLKLRVTEIEAKVEALDLRMQTIQRAVEIQTTILQEMKAEGKFPKKYLPQEGAAAPTN